MNKFYGTAISLAIFACALAAHAEVADMPARISPGAEKYQGLINGALTSQISQGGMAGSGLAGPVHLRELSVFDAQAAPRDAGADPEDVKGIIDRCSDKHFVAAIAVARFRTDSGQLYQASLPMCIDQMNLIAPAIGYILGGKPKLIDEGGAPVITFAMSSVDVNGIADRSGCADSRELIQRQCTASGLGVVAIDFIDKGRSSGSALESITPAPGAPNCVDVKFYAKGAGYNHAFGVQTDCAGAARFDYALRFLAVRSTNY